MYDEIPDVSLLTKAMEHYLKEYNTVSKAPMPLVMFRYATEHASRINRIIKQRGQILISKLSLMNILPPMLGQNMVLQRFSVFANVHPSLSG